MLRFEEAAAPASPDERLDQRQDPRYTISPEASWTTSLTSTTSLISAEVRNLSVRGAGLLVDAPLPLGAEASIDLASESGEFRVRPRLRVIHVTALGPEGFLVGCRFLTPLTYDQLRMLLR